MKINLPQMIYTVFFAIFWGTVAGAWPRWKPFHLSLFHKHKKIRWRAFTAFVCLNALPVLVAGLTLFMLSGHGLKKDCSGLGSWLWLFIVGVVPAFSMFGFSRLWVGIIELSPDKFYFKRNELQRIGLPAESSEEEVEPSQESLRLDRSIPLGLPDIIWGLIYIAICEGFAFVVYKTYA
jgi:hypothetical protein